MQNIGSGKFSKGAPLHPQTVKLNKLLTDNRTLMSSENNTILDTISSNDSRQYFYNSPQSNFQFNNKLQDLNTSANIPLAPKAGTASKEDRLYSNRFESPQNTAYFRDSTLKQSYDGDNYSQFRREQVTPNSLDYSASTDFNAQGLSMSAFQSKNLSMSKNLGNIHSQHEILQKAYPYNYDENQFETLGPSPTQHRDRRLLHHDEELESTVFGQSSINPATFKGDTTRLSDEQAYFGNMKAHPNTAVSLSGTGNKGHFHSNFQTISSSAESTPHKAFKAGFMAQKYAPGHEILTAKPTQSYESVGRSYESDFGYNFVTNSKLHQNIGSLGARIDNEMDEDKAPFNPMSTHDQYDLKKYTAKQQEGNEIYIDQDVQPIVEQSDEESRIGYTGNTTPISSEPRGGYPISSSTTTPQNYTATHREERKLDVSPYANSNITQFERSTRHEGGFSFPKYRDDEKSKERSTSNYRLSDNENTFDDKTTNLTGYKSFIGKDNSNLTHTMKNSSTPDGYSGQSDSLIGSHLYQKHQLNNLHFSQLSQGSIGPYDATTSKILSSPAIYERGPESEEESQNDSQLKMSQLKDSPRRDEPNKKLRFEELEQPRTGVIGENTNRFTASSSLRLMSSLETGSTHLDSKPRRITDFEENDYKAHFQNFVQKHYDKQVELEEIKPSSIFKNRGYQRFQSRYKYLNKRNEQDYDTLKKVKLFSIFGPEKERDVEQMIDNLKAKENIQTN